MTCNPGAGGGSWCGMTRHAHRNRNRAVWALVAAGVVVVFFAWKHRSARLPEEDLSAIQTALASGARLVDVRTRQEFAAGHIQGAINIPVSELPDSLSRLGNKQTPLVVYCQSGNRSSKAVSYLRQRGFKTVLDMKTIANWRAVQAM